MLFIFEEPIFANFATYKVLTNYGFTVIVVQELARFGIIISIRIHYNLMKIHLSRFKSFYVLNFITLGKMFAYTHTHEKAWNQVWIIV